MNYKKHLEELMKNPEFKKEYEALEGEYQVRSAVYRARSEKGITQRQLAEISDIPQKTISQIETGNVIPNVSTLSKIAHGLGKELEIRFV